MKLFQKGELKLLWPFYLDALFSTMLFFAPAFYVIFFADLGFSFFEIGVLLSAIPLASLIFEIPTGAFADLYGRKRSVMLGTILMGFGFFSLAFFHSFSLILASFAFIGFGATFVSGARDAWVTDLIKKNNKELLRGFFAKVMSIDSFGLVISGIFGAFLVAKYGLNIIWLFSFLSFLVSFILLFFAKEDYKTKGRKFKDSFKEIKKQSRVSIDYSRKHPVLLYFLFAGMAFIFAYSFNGPVSWAPFMQGQGLPDYAFGYLWSGMALIGVFAPLIGMKMHKKGNEKKFLIMLSVVWFLLSFLIIFVFGIAIAFAFLLGLTFIEDTRRPAERVYFHKFIPSKLRATVGSVESMLLAIGGIIAMPIAGIVIDRFGARYSIAISGIFAIVAVFLYWKIKEPETKNQALKS